jgi:hypothetical protein
MIAITDDAATPCGARMKKPGAGVGRALTQFRSLGFCYHTSET